MRLVPIQDLVVGDVFAKEIKLRGRQAHEVMDVTENGLIFRTRGQKTTTSMSYKDGKQVYWLRNIFKP